MTPSLCYLICATPRTGSCLLCEALESTGVAGRPAEFFWTNSPRRVSPLSRIFEVGTTPNGVWGCKLMWDYASDVLPMLEPLRPRLIYLSRHDRLAQAVSWARALQTGAWRHGQSEEAEPVYCREQIRNLLADIEADNAGWCDYFAEVEVLPLTLSYERLAADVPGTVARVLDYLGLPAAPARGEVGGYPPTRPPLGPLRSRVQRDATSVEWVRRYREDAL